jgi:hypothetical protein
MVRGMNSKDADGGRRPAETSRPGVLAVFGSHWLAMTGLGLVITAIISWACLLPSKLKHGDDNPYVGLATLVIAGVFVLGLLITPLGLRLGRKRLQERIEQSAAAGGFAWRRLFVFLAVVSLINLLIASQLTFRAIHAMESRQFCGSCHVMTPESRAFEVGAHAGLMCVDCHVGEGAVGFVKSKIQGTHQLISVLTDKVKKPIEGAIESGKMVPTAETCEQCHWKGQPAKATLRLFQHYAEDEKNTPETTLLTMNVGGSRMGGIHGAHYGEGISISFVPSDPKRSEIPYVEYRNAKTNESRNYVKSGANAASFANQPRVEMQCFDCHNRPAHAFQAPDRAVDQAITLGRISATLPFVKKTSVEILKAQYPSSEAAATAIPAALANYYQKNYPDLARDKGTMIHDAGLVLADLYSRNVFPDLGVTWGTYLDHRGHQTSPGCFRCHDGEHVASGGEKITKECFRCHFPSAVAETNPEMLKLLGVDTILRNMQDPKK